MTAAGLWSPLWRPSYRRWLGVLLMAPCSVVVLLLIIYPLAVAFDLSFQKLRIMRVGAARQPFTPENYERLLGCADFWHAAEVSLGFVVIVTLGCFSIGLAAALL